MTDTDLQPFRELASGLRQLADEAQRIYAAEVTAIIRHSCRDTQQIEHALDGLLGFCYDESLLNLYRILCRYDFTLDPQATVEYVQAYREMWDTEASDEAE